MGIVEVISQEVIIFSNIITYGNATNPEITQQIRDEIETLWNEPAAILHIDNTVLRIRFRITAKCIPHITEIDVLRNTNPKNNYFRIEEFAKGNISFVDGLGCNSGYFKLDNLLPGWTTAAHEYGHTLGLDHPKHLDLRGKGRPGIMYPRGTLVDPKYQYDSTKPAGETGGTMHPMYRKVMLKDINDLQLQKHILNKHMIIGEFTNVYHWDHADDL